MPILILWRSPWGWSFLVLRQTNHRIGAYAQLPSQTSVVKTPTAFLLPAIAHKPPGFEIAEKYWVRFAIRHAHSSDRQALTV
jgi:hypothetical protein